MRNTNQEDKMDVRSQDIEPFMEHEDVIVHSMVPKFTMRDETMGGFLELVDVFEIKDGAKAEPHYHDTHEFYFILEGEPIVQIEDEARLLKVGDLVHIPRNARHSIWPTGGKDMRGFCFAISYQEPYDPGYQPCELHEVEVSEG
jgi:quercetin dioxygenase-like cupin family protein